MSTKVLDVSNATDDAERKSNDRQGMALPLLPIQPILKSKIWGGTHFPPPGDDEPGPIGESWQIADLEEGVTRIASGEMAGNSLRDLVERFGTALVGKRATAGRFPFLVKVIDAAQMLSVQVHPDDEGARHFAGAASKEETWYFLEGRGAVLHGLKQKTERPDFEAALRGGRVTDLLREVPARKGAVLHVPPGTLHAIGADVFLLEVQEPSDTTFRVWDYGRMGLDGKARPLHVNEALQVSSLDQAPTAGEPRAPTQLRGNVQATLLADTDCYRIEEVIMKAGSSWSLQLSGDTCVLATLLRGSIAYSSANDRSYPGRMLESMLIPAACQSVDITCSADATLILTGVGGCPLAAPDATL